MKRIQTFDNFSQESSSSLSEGAYNRLDVERAVDSGMAAFWEEVAKNLPEIKSGDFSPGDYINLERAMTTAVQDWIKQNA